MAAATGRGERGAASTCFCPEELDVPRVRSQHEGQALQAQGRVPGSALRRGPEARPLAPGRVWPLPRRGRRLAVVSFPQRTLTRPPRATRSCRPESSTVPDVEGAPGARGLLTRASPGNTARNGRRRVVLLGPRMRAVSSPASPRVHFDGSHGRQDQPPVAPGVRAMAAERRRRVHAGRRETKGDGEGGPGCDTPGEADTSDCTGPRAGPKTLTRCVCLACETYSFSNIRVDLFFCLKTKKR